MYGSGFIYTFTYRPTHYTHSLCKILQYKPISNGKLHIAAQKRERMKQINEKSRKIKKKYIVVSVQWRRVSSLSLFLSLSTRGEEKWQQKKLQRRMRWHWTSCTNTKQQQQLLFVFKRKRAKCLELYTLWAIASFRSTLSVHRPFWIPVSSI